MSSSMFFGSKVMFKSVLAANVASLLGWSAIINGDRLGGIVYNEKNHLELKPQARDRAIMRFNQRLQAVSKPGCLIIIISDFMTIEPSFEKYISRLKRHNEILVCHISDILEKEPPPYGIYTVSDGQKELTLDTSNFDVRENYRNQYLDRIGNLTRILKNNHIPLLQFDTQQDPYETLCVNFARRRR